MFNSEISSLDGAISVDHFSSSTHTIKAIKQHQLNFVRSKSRFLNESQVSVIQLSLSKTEAVEWSSPHLQSWCSCEGLPRPTI
jgi:hypothetical protein